MGSLKRVDLVFLVILGQIVFLFLLVCCFESNTFRSRLHLVGFLFFIFSFFSFGERLPSIMIDNTTKPDVDSHLIFSPYSVCACVRARAWFFPPLLWGGDCCAAHIHQEEQKKKRKRKKRKNHIYTITGSW